MSSDFDNILLKIKRCSPDQKQRIFNEIRDSITIHDLERRFNIRAETILEAIDRASDLTQRGVRGVVAETVFTLEIVPTLQVYGWRNDTPTGDHPYDVRVSDGRHSVRIQVKLQRKKEGEPEFRRAQPRARIGPKDHAVVEVQRTRGGTDAEGQKTRPYRFGEFDLLAVCMEPSTRNWQAFRYAPASALEPDPRDPRAIRTFQLIPPSDTDIWTSDLAEALKRATS